MKLLEEILSTRLGICLYVFLNIALFATLLIQAFSDGAQWLLLVAQVVNLWHSVEKLLFVFKL